MATSSDVAASQLRLWSLLGWLYEALFALVPHRKLVEDVADRLSASDYVLDAGCGTGRLSMYSRSRVIGVDLSPTMLRYARRHGARAVQGDLTKLPFNNGGFDVVVSLNVLYTVPDATGALAEMGRVVRSGGEVWVATPVTSKLSPLLSEHFRAAGPRDHAIFLANIPRLLAWMVVLAVRGATSKAEFHFYTEEELCQMFESVGLEVISTEPCYAGLDRLITARKG